MTLRLVVSGFPCAPAPWLDYFSSGDQSGVRTEILSLAEVFSHTQGEDPRTLGRYAAQVIAAKKPDMIVAHDFGSMLAGIALLRLQKENDRGSAKHKLPSCVTFLSGAFRYFNVLKNTHPLKIQLHSVAGVWRILEAGGAKADEALKPHVPRIKKLYRLVAMNSVLEVVRRDIFKQEPKPFNLSMPGQVIGSTNDPYMNWRAAECMARDLGINDVHWMAYGHFPYAVGTSGEEVLRMIRQFEAKHI